MNLRIEAEPDGVISDSAALPKSPTPSAASQHHSLKHHLLGPSLTKAGQDAVDQKQVAEVIYEASKGSKYFNNEEVKDKILTQKIERILRSKAQLEKLDLKTEMRKADEYITSLEVSRDLSQYVVHIDCDAFYAAVELIDRPDLEHVPFAVGQGVLTTCNYHARKFGCRSAMAGFVAKKLCPQLICLPLNFEKYTAKAKEVRAILAEYDPRYESSSIDEAYLNITEYCQVYDLDPELAVAQLRREVQEKCKVTISAGIAPNAKLAKICSNRNKPNGQFRIPNDRTSIMSFMNSLPVRKVNGVGRVFERELQAIGIDVCGDIHAHRAYLGKLFGDKAFQFLMQTYLGLGRTDVQPAEEHERKSVGTESTFRDMSNKAELRAKLRHTAEELEKDMRRVGVKGRTLVLKIKLHTYEVFTRQVAPPKAVHLAEDLYSYSLPMLTKLEKDTSDFKIRLMGLRCTHLVSTKKSDMDFFRRPGGPLNRSKSLNDSGTATAIPDQGEWEVWPDSEFEEAARQERREEIEELEQLSQEHEDEQQRGKQQRQAEDDGAGQDEQDLSHSTADWHRPFGRYKFGSEPNTPAKVKDGRGNENAGSDDPEFWDCPICQFPQPANDKEFNIHIDTCLSRGTIREAVAAATVSSSASLSALEDGASDMATATSMSLSLSGLDRDRSRSRTAGGASAGGGVKRKVSLTSKVADDSKSNCTRKQKKLFFA